MRAVILPDEYLSALGDAAEDLLNEMLFVEDYDDILRRVTTSADIDRLHSTLDRAIGLIKQMTEPSGEGAEG